MPISDVLRYLRTKQRYDQSTIANRLDMQRSTYGKYESNASTPTVKRIIDIAKIYKVSTDFLIYGYDISKFIDICKTVLLANVNGVMPSEWAFEIDYIIHKYSKDNFNKQPDIEDIQLLIDSLDNKLGSRGIEYSTYPLYYFFEVSGHLDLAAYLIENHKLFYREEYINFQDLQTEVQKSNNGEYNPVVNYNSNSIDAAANIIDSKNTQKNINNSYFEEGLNPARKRPGLFSGSKPSDSVKNFTEEERDELLEYVDYLLSKRRNSDE